MPGFALELFLPSSGDLSLLLSQLHYSVFPIPVGQRIQDVSVSTHASALHFTVGAFLLLYSEMLRTLSWYSGALLQATVTTQGIASLKARHRVEAH